MFTNKKRKEAQQFIEKNGGEIELLRSVMPSSSVEDEIIFHPKRSRFPGSIFESWPEKVAELLMEKGFLIYQEVPLTFDEMKDRIEAFGKDAPGVTDARKVYNITSKAWEKIYVNKFSDEAAKFYNELLLKAIPLMKQEGTGTDLLDSIKVICHKDEFKLPAINIADFFRRLHYCNDIPISFRKQEDLHVYPETDVFLYFINDYQKLLYKSHEKYGVTYCNGAEYMFQVEEAKEEVTREHMKKVRAGIEEKRLKEKADKIARLKEAPL